MTIFKQQPKLIAMAGKSAMQKESAYVVKKATLLSDWIGMGQHHGKEMTEFAPLFSENMTLEHNRARATFDDSDGVYG